MDTSRMENSRVENSRLENSRFENPRMTGQSLKPGETKYYENLNIVQHEALLRSNRDLDNINYSASLLAAQYRGNTDEMDGDET